MYMYKQTIQVQHKLTATSWLIIGNKLLSEKIPLLYSSNLEVASIPQEIGPRANISAFILSAPDTEP